MTRSSIIIENRNGSAVKGDSTKRKINKYSRRAKMHFYLSPSCDTFEMSKISRIHHNVERKEFTKKKINKINSVGLYDFFFFFTY